MMLALGLMGGMGQSAALAEQDNIQAYFFGNSLVHHVENSTGQTNVPHWIDAMAEADGRRFAVDGQWGFLRNFAADAAPTAKWGFPGVQGVWSPDDGPFGAAGYDAVIVTPANFIQYQEPDVPYDGENAGGDSPYSAALRLFDRIAGQSPDSRLYLYEGWAEMAGVVATFPPDEADFERYHALNAGSYHRWYRTLLDDIAIARPALEIELIPVASVLAGLFAEGGLLSDLDPRALYTDDAPHGTETLYLLAAMVTYSALYDVAPPSGWTPPDGIATALRQNYPAIAAEIWRAVQNAGPAQVRPAARAAAEEGPAIVTAPDPDLAAEAAEAEEGGGNADAAGAVDSGAAVAPGLPERAQLALPQPGMRPSGIPALAMGLNGISDWSTQHPFLDLMKSSRAWVGHVGDTWGAVSAEELRSAGHVNPQGWPVSMPDGVRALEAVLLTDQAPEAEHLRGRYVLRYEGEGPIRLEGRAKRVRYEPGRITFDYEPGPGLVAISLPEIPSDNPIRNISIVKSEHLPLYEAGALFNPLWIETVQDMRALRFMDWMMTNGSVVRNWQDRPRMEDATWTVWGVPLEVMVRLANRIGADPWFTMPHQADDDYVRRFATQVRDTLDPELKAWVEYSNEVWNFLFPQAHWAAAQAEALWGKSDTGWMQYYGLRAAQVADLWTGVFGDEADARLMRVVSTHTGWPQLEESILMAPLAFLQLGRAPQESFDAYAVTGYFGYEMGGPEMAPRINDWLDRSEAAARAAGEAAGLRRVALREYVRERRFDAAFTPVARALSEGSLRELVEEVFPYHAGAASRAGLTLVMYEGGTHVTGVGTAVNDERLTAFFTAFNYTPEMAKLYEILLLGWINAGGVLFNAFVDVAPATQWGSWGALRHLNDSNPRWDMLMAYNASAPSNWEARPLSAFANGINRVVTSGNQRMMGTSKEDLLIGGPGNDTLIGSGGDDILQGGGGSDRAILPGARADYAFERDGARLIARGPRGTVRLAGIETLVFEATPAESTPVSEF
ncbi:calcium-binding protein [Cognatishimia sp. F0-27]|nr:calcium-binding protein [Cognatishimia sp. F0-27]